MKHSLLIGLSFLFLFFSCTESKTRHINSVTGPIALDLIGLALVHEHMLVDFIGSDSVSSNRYSHDKVIAKVLPYLLEVKKFGVKTIFDCTPSYLAKDPVLLKKLSEQSGIQIITNTGLYGTQKGKFLPEYAFTETAEQLAVRWISEYNNGIEGTGIKPGFIKISVNEDDPLGEMDAKLVKAAGLTFKETGLKIYSHTGTWNTAKQEVEILQKIGVDPSAFVWVHAQAEEDFQNYLEAAKLGVWISLDGIGWSLDEYVDRLDFVPFTNIFEKLMPTLNAKGFEESDWKLLLVENPKQAFGNE